MNLKTLINEVKERIYLDSYQKSYIKFNEEKIKESNNNTL